MNRRDHKRAGTHKHMETVSKYFDWHNRLSFADEDRSAGWKLQVFIYFHRHLSAPAISPDNSQVGVAICHPF